MLIKRESKETSYGIYRLTGWITVKHEDKETRHKIFNSPIHSKHRTYFCFKGARIGIPSNLSDTYKEINPKINCISK